MALRFALCAFSFLIYFKTIRQNMTQLRKENNYGKE